MKRLVRSKWFVILLVVFLAGSFLWLHFNPLSFVQNNQVRAASLNSSSRSNSPCLCHSKADFNKVFIVPQEAELKKLVLVTKRQGIYNDYKEFLEKEGYVEWTNSTVGGFFRKTPAIKKNDVKIADRKFSYSIDLNIKKPYLLSIPYVNPLDNNKIAGIVFVYSHRRVLSYVVEANNIKNPKSISVNILVENDNGEITSASNVDTPDIYVDWQCVQRCIPGALARCLSYMGTPYYPVCVAAAWECAMISVPYLNHKYIN